MESQRGFQDYFERFFTKYADTLLSIHQIAQSVTPIYNIIHTTLREGEDAFEGGLPLLWERIKHPSMALPR